MPKIRKKKPRIRKVFASSGSDFKMMVTSFLILGTLLIVLMGRKTLMTLKGFNEAPLSESIYEMMISAIVVTTTIESNIFHQS